MMCQCETVLTAGLVDSGVEGPAGCVGQSGKKHLCPFLSCRQRVCCPTRYLFVLPAGRSNADKPRRESLPASWPAQSALSEATRSRALFSWLAVVAQVVVVPVQV